MTTMTYEAVPALAATGLGKRYRRGWALRDCDLTVPAGRAVALIGPNGAGKSTLMRVAAGLLEPTTGSLRVLGERPGRQGAHRAPAFLAQDKPMFKAFTVAEMLRTGQALNPGWDADYARQLVDDAQVPLSAKVGTLSGGQRTRVALAIALGRRPQMIMLDEPLADLDPLARSEVMSVLMAEAAETAMTVVLSSHLLSDLDGVCDHLLLLADGRVRLAGEIEELLAEHRLMIGPRGVLPFDPESVVEARFTARQSTVLIRDAARPAPAGWILHEPSLEEVALGYLRQARESAKSAVDGGVRVGVAA
jgi:ABC-2 type transport system ATP-binding protein